MDLMDPMGLWISDNPGGVESCSLKSLQPNTTSKGAIYNRTISTLAFENTFKSHENIMKTIFVMTLLPKWDDHPSSV